MRMFSACSVDGNGERTVYDADVVVFAVGVQAMQVRFMPIELKNLKRGMVLF